MINEVWKVIFAWEGLNIYVTGCSTDQLNLDDVCDIHWNDVNTLTERGRDVADEKQALLLVKHSFYSLQLQYYPIALFSSAIWARGIVSSYSASELNWQLALAVFGSAEENGIKFHCMLQFYEP